MSTDFDEWLCKRLDGLGLDSDVYSGYACGLMEDADTPLDQRTQAVGDVLGAATEEDISEFLAELGTQWQKKVESTLNARQKEDDRKRSEEQKKLLQERLEAEEAEAERRARDEVARGRTREERQERERLLNEYGFDVINEVDEDGNLVLTAPKKENADGDLGLDRNMNKEIVKQKEAANRAKAKEDHRKQQQRNKELLEKDRLKKEKAKQRTQKREKRRGCG